MNDLSLSQKAIHGHYFAIEGVVFHGLFDEHFSNWAQFIGDPENKDVPFLDYLYFKAAPALILPLDINTREELIRFRADIASFFKSKRDGIEAPAEE